MVELLGLNEIRVRAAEFVRNWVDEPGDEKQQGHEFMRQLLGVYSEPAARAALYERRAKRASTGERGYVDGLVPGVVAIEMKSAGKDLVDATAQAFDYLASLPEEESPAWVLTSDFKHFRITRVEGTNTAPSQGAVEEFGLEDLPRRAEELGFIANFQMRRFGSAEQEDASVKAAKLMGNLYKALDQARYGEHEASVFMVRLLFCLYADDAGVWSKDLFWDFVEDTRHGEDLGPRLSQLFQVMDRPPERRQANLDASISKFPYVDGGLFSEVLPIPAFSTDMRDRLLEACAFNWSAISPAVFGSMFQSVKDKKARRELGEHYTTETNILKVIEPLFLDELRGEFAAAGSDMSALRRLRNKMGRMRFLDPACGCGNFLVVAYRELRALDLEILERMQELQPFSKNKQVLNKERGTLFFNPDSLPVRLDHFRGIEIDEFPAVIARTVLHLADHQANQAMEWALGQGPETLPLTRTDTIHQGNALRMDWDSVWPEDGVPDTGTQLYVFGNPPFLGHKTRTVEQAQELRDVWDRNDIGRLDYVTGWYAKTLDLFKRPGHDGEFAFVSTNSITQGEPVPALFGPVFDAGWRIKFAHRTFAWSSEAPGAAAVHCVIVGFDHHPKSSASLYEYTSPKAHPVRRTVEHQINAYLIDGPKVFIGERRGKTGLLAPDLPVTTFGNMPRDDGNLVVTPDEYEAVAADSVAAKYLRPYIGARELIHGEDRWCLWLVDVDPSDLARSKTLRERVEAVRTFRLKSTASSTRGMAATPHLFGQRSHRDVPHLLIPSVSSETRRFLPCAHVGPETIASNLVFTAEDPNGLAFAVISSSAFITWQRAVGGRLKSDLRFSNTLTWNTFPLPKLDEATRVKLIEAGQAVLDTRALHPERSLADHYNPLAMDPALLKAHGRLDAVMDRALGAKHTCADNTERLTLLFADYAAMTAAEAPELKLRGRRLKGA